MTRKEIVVTSVALIDRVPVFFDGSHVDDAVKTGNYDWEHPQLTTCNFPSTVRVRNAREVQFIVHFGLELSTDEILWEFDRIGLRPACAEELLALGSQQPDLQRQFPIVALGSSWSSPDSRRAVPVLIGYDNGRYASLGWVNGQWPADCRFLAVRKKL